MPRTMVWISLVGALAAGCRHTSAAEPSAPSTKEPSAELAGKSPAAAPTPAAAASAKAERPRPEGRVHLDLAAHVERAELRRGHARLLSLGERAVPSTRWAAG